MSLPEALGLSVALLVMLVGLAGCVLPAVPGTPLILASAVGHRLWFGPAGAPWWVLGVMLFLMLLSIAAEQLAGLFGAKALGATRRGMIGAIVGGLIGIFFGPAGILLGPFLGAVAGELTGGRELRDSARAGFGAAVGVLAGTVGKLACGLAMTGLFLGDLLWQAWRSTA
ncbi:MAG: DUF456 domain-containing protein [Limisphaerales bacterium]